MLRYLSIRRLAVIDAVDVEFDRGFNVLTGETGAGKSILVEAVGLLLGGRASGDLVRTGEDLATIEAIFEHDGKEIQVRREISSQGRSRAFIDGDLATAGALRDLSVRLIELHGQHEHHTLLEPTAHVRVLDELAGLEPELGRVGEAFTAMREAGDELERLRRRLAERGARLELAAFQFAELQKAVVTPREDESLAATRQVLANAERVERLCAESYAALYEDDDAVLAVLGTVWKRIAELSALDPQFQPYLDARDGLKSQLEDLAHFLRRYADGIEASPARLQEVEDRLALLERLKRKYGPTLDDVIRRRTELEGELAELEGGEDRRAELQSNFERLRNTYLKESQVLSNSRREAGKAMPARLQAVLAELAMDGTMFQVRFGDPIDEAAWTANGIDQVEFYVSPNPGEEPRPLARIVSGGELSRIMLALKTLTATSRHGFSESGERAPGAAAPGLIFDEVDAGIGGRAAEDVGRKLRMLGSAFQVLCITHLPQIAACADTHFAIEKRVEAGRTRTSVTRLDDETRIEELSRMLGGAGITDAVRASAREMLARRNGGEAMGGAGGNRSGAKAKGERRKSGGER